MLQQVTSDATVANLPFDLEHCPTVGEVMSRDVLTVSPLLSLTEAGNQMEEHRVSCVVVLEGQSVVGMLTQKDLLNAMSSTSPTSFNHTVADHMATNITWILPSQTVFEASQAMEELRIRHLPVLREGHLVGLVSQTDLIHILISFGSLRGVDEIMCADIATIPVEATVQEAIDIMAARRLSCIIVQEAKHSVGIITERDIVRKIVVPQKDPYTLTVRELMSSPLKSIDTSYSIHGAGCLMQQKGIHRLVIMENNELVGLITQTDILQAVQCGLQAEHAALDAQAACREVEAKLIQSEKLATVGQLAAGVAHELNTPVGFVSNNLETLRKYTVGLLELLQLYERCHQANRSQDYTAGSDLCEKIIEKRQKINIEFMQNDILDLLAESMEGLEHVTSIVRNLRDFSRIDKTEQSSSYDINEGIRNILVVAHNALKYNVELQLELGEVPEVQAHGNQINQVILNIVTNAAQAIRAQARDDKGTITIRTETTDAHLVCEITDNGPGIAPENLNRIFDSFFTTKPPGQGTGLGLSVSYDIIVNKHQGELNVISAIDQGTTFTLKLPLNPVCP